MDQNQSQSAFEAIPIELHLNVLSLMSGPEDVLSTIQASPAALRALQKGREQVYAAVLQTSLAPEVFREFLAILNAPDHNACPRVRPYQTDAQWEEDGDSILREWKAWEQKAGGFLRSHAQGAFYPTPTPKPNLIQFKDRTKFLIRLYFCVSRLINSYLPYATSRATGTRINLPPANPSGPEPLTDTERLRLQRGLLRYELCCRLIGMPSIAAYCNNRVYADVVAPHPVEIREFWESDPFSQLLPVDEVEELVSASEFAHGLYGRLRCTFVEDFEEAVLDWSKHCDRGVSHRDNSDSKEKRTVADWLSDSPLKGGYHPFKWGGEFASRLGLVFLDRIIRSTPTGRREFMRSAFHTFRRLDRDDFLRTSWHSVVTSRDFWTDQDRAVPLKVGPHCNAMIQAASSDYETIKDLADQSACGLRRQGWAYFDDQSRLRSLDLPDTRASSIRKFVWDELRMGRSFFRVEIGDSALAARFTEDEWKELFDKYSPKDLGDDLQAMTRFVSDARSVVDFDSNQIPQMN